MLGGRTTLIAALVAGTMLLWMAVPRFAAGLLVAPHGEIFDRLQKGERISLAEFDSAIRDHVRALDWHDNSHDRMRLGQLHFAAAMLTDVGPGERRRRLIASARAHEAALSRDPAQPYAWTQLAVALAALEGHTRRVAGVLAEANRSAPYAPRLVMPRIDLGLWAWPNLRPEERQLVADQLDIAARLLPRRFRREFESADRRARLHKALTDRPGLLCRLEAVLSRVDPATRC